MANMPPNDASRLVRKDKSPLQRDIERGLLGKTEPPDGDLRIDSDELTRTYAAADGNDHAVPRGGMPPEQVRLALLEERIRSLERALSLEAELRRSKDHLANELRARLADKENLIRVLESKVMFLEYDRQIEDVPTLEHSLEREEARRPDQGREHQPQPSPRRERTAWWSRLFRGRRGD